MRGFADLIGKTITSFELNEGNDRLTLHVQDGPPLALEVDGDCCSQSWIESLDAPDALLGTIQEVEQIEMPNRGDVGTPKHPSVDCVAYYGLKITTDKGRCVIDYRNDSNGYYGGSIYLVKP